MKLFYRNINGSGRKKTDIKQPLVVDEVNALIRYASERGIDPPGPDTSKPEETTLVLLNKAVMAYEKDQSESKNESRSEVLRHYAALTKKTRIDGYNINGRTLLDTQRERLALFWPALLTVVLLLIAIANEILISWLADIPIPEEGYIAILNAVQKHGLQLIIPFVWGGLGACIFLSKRLYDVAQYRAFDRAKLHGWYLRVILAAVLAAVVLYLFDPTAFTEDGVPLDSKAIAFLVGLGVKVVYGALETLVETLVDKFNLDALRRAPTQSNGVQSYLTQKLADPEVEKDPERKKVLVSLVQEYEKEKSGS